MRTIAVIPARFQSKRLPGKPLADIHGKTLVERVYERASEATRIDRVLVATDDARIVEAVSSFGGEAVLTSPRHPSGSDRIAEAVGELEVDVVVNVQGDEPLIAPEAIDSAVALAERTPGAIVSLKTAITERSKLLDPNVVKVVTDLDGFALYFSRSPIPVAPEVSIPPKLYFKHLGLYVYPKTVLMALTRLTPSPLEQAERLEQLRALENGMRIRLEETQYESVGVDTEDDLEAVRALLSGRATVQ